MGLKKLNIAPEDLVLEVGSGDSPVPRSDVLSDKYLGYTPARGGRELFIDIRPFVVCDGQELPFKDQSFDYIIASQMIVYMDDPELFLRELMRVGKKGYIEVPNETRMVLFDWDMIKYVVSVNDDGKMLIRKKRGKGPFGDLFRKLNDPLFNKFISDNWSLFNYMVEWDERIKYEIDENEINMMELSKELNIEFVEYSDLKTLNSRLRMLRWAIMALVPLQLRKQVVALIRRVNNKREYRRILSMEELLKILCCPLCKGDLQLNEKEEYLICQSCKQSYPIIVKNKKRIPIMLIGGME